MQLTRCLLGHDWELKENHRHYAKEKEFPTKVTQQCKACKEEREVWI